MRRFLASAFGLSATLALVAGLVFAFTGTASQQAGTPSVIGTVNVSLQIDSYTGSPLLPGTNTKTATGRVNNNTGVAIALTSGNISGINVPANTGCNAYLSGSVTAPGAFTALTPARILDRYVFCSPCFRTECPYGHECMKEIGVGEAVRAVLESLEAGGGRQEAGSAGPPASRGLPPAT